MTMSNYPNGFAGGVTIRGVPIQQVHPGKVFWVNGSSVLPDGGVGGSNGNDGSYLRPFATLDYAVGKCKAARGDIIAVMPGHTETLNVTTSLLTLDVQGIAIVGLGGGSLRPTITMGTDAAVTVDVSADDISISNMVFVANKLDVASCFTLAAATDFNVENCEFRDSTAILNFLSIVTTSAVANAHDGLRFHNNKVFGLNTTPLAVVSILEDVDRMELSDNYANLAATSGGEFVTLSSKDSINTLISGNIHNPIGATDTTTGIFLTGSGTSTGVMKDNKVASLDTTTELIITAGTGLRQFENYYTGTADKSAKLWPVVDGA